MKSRRVLSLVAWSIWLSAACGAREVETDLRRMELSRGIVAVIDTQHDTVDYVLGLCLQSELTVYYQTSDAEHVAEVRQAAQAAGLLGTRLFVELGSPLAIHLGDNIADRILMDLPADQRPPQAEVLRALRPRGIAWAGQDRWVKPVPDGTDDWTHPYHGPDNNPQSNDQLVHGELRTQFIGYPKFCPMPEQSVVAGGRIYKAMGHIAHKANQNEMLNTLVCINAYNGTILWKRPLSEGFMLHRNTMIATDDALYMGDHESCKIIDGQTGEIRDEITIDPAISDGPVWKWMAIRDGVLYALVGNPEVEIETQRALRRGLGHWPWGMWDGHDYNDPRTSFGFGRTLVAIDLSAESAVTQGTDASRPAGNTTPNPATSSPHHAKRVIWHHRNPEFLDARAVCMNDTQLFCYCPEKFLMAIDLETGQPQWQNSDQDLLEAIAGNQPAQHYITGFSTTCYMKCSQDYLFFAGPQRSQMVVASAHDGKLAWTFHHGNLQLVLRQDGVWAAGPQKDSGRKFDYATGEVLATFPQRRNCTRATGCLDSIFYRAHGGTVRVLTESNTAQHIDPMRPPCQDGVIVAGGHLYWGPWMCGCELSLYGNIGLRPAASSSSPPNDGERLIRGPAVTQLASLDIQSGDWSTYRGNNARTDTTQTDFPDELRFGWAAEVCDGVLPTAPVTAGGMVFVADRRGGVHAYTSDGALVWQALTGGPIYYPPVVAHDRVYVGSADGRVYAFAAREGTFLWSFRVGPADYWIPIFDQLISAWPVAGGVVVEGDTLYAAAGITHYDGTHVVALDARSGELKRSNTQSGTLEPTVNNGISLQGDLMIADGELQFLAGGVYETARYDLQTLECLNQPLTQVSSQYRTAFYPYYPEYGKYVSLDYQCQDGCQLSHDASYEGSQFSSLVRLPPLPAGAPREPKEAARWVRRGGEVSEPLWSDSRDRRFTGFAISEEGLLATGHAPDDESQAFLVSIDPVSGSDRWVKSLPANAVRGGMSVDHRGRVFIALENGQLLSFESK